MDMDLEGTLLITIRIRLVRTPHILQHTIHVSIS
jgi:hypothetical protein